MLCCSVVQVQHHFCRPLSLFFMEKMKWTTAMEVSTKEGIEEKRSSCCSSTHSSPEFEFWFTRNRSSFPEPEQFSTADKLFVDGFLLPLHPQVVEPVASAPSPSSDFSSETAEVVFPAGTLSASSSVTSSQRWKDILFKKPKAYSNGGFGDGNLVEKKMGQKARGREHKGGTAVASAELNINIWPFSRSRSAGTDSGRPKLASNRKISSAPCSRSNSSGESKSKAWQKSPTRAQTGVHLGRSSPVWQARRGGTNAGDVASTSNSCKKQAATGKPGGIAVADGTAAGKVKPRKTPSPRTKILNLTVPLCIGYRPHLSCGADEQYISIDTRQRCGGCDAPGAGTSNFGGNILNLRTLFGKKVY